DFYPNASACASAKAARDPPLGRAAFIDQLDRLNNLKPDTHFQTERTISTARSLMSSEKPIAIYHEHPDWFWPVFKELERRGVPFVRTAPRRHWYDASAQSYNFSLLFNRMSPSAYLRQGVQGTFFTLNFVAHLESLGIPVVNGHKAFTYEISKALQLNLLKT